MVIIGKMKQVTQLWIEIMNENYIFISWTVLSQVWLIRNDVRFKQMLYVGYK